MSRYWVRLAELLGVNSIPIVGVLAGQWSPATALSVYWIENLLASIFTAARLYFYARWTDPATHPVVAEGSSFALRRPGPFLAMTIPFTLAHAVMLAGVFAVVLHMQPDFGDLQSAAFALLVVQGLAFGFDLWTLADWPVARVNDRADYLQGRVMLVHLSIFVGMFLVAWFDRPGAFFAFFVGAKALSDLGQLLPRIDSGTPDAPPRWLAAVMKRFPRHNGESFEEHWRRTHKGGDRGPGTMDRGEIGGAPGVAAITRPPLWRAKRKKR